jgi:hypothetical protein
MSSRITWRMMLLCTSLCLLTGFATLLQSETKPAPTGGSPAVAAAAANSADSLAKGVTRKIDLSAAMNGNLPEAQDLKTVSFRSPCSHRNRDGARRIPPGNDACGPTAFQDQRWHDPRNRRALVGRTFSACTPHGITRDVGTLGHGLAIRDSAPLTRRNEAVSCDDGSPNGG